MKKRGIFKLIRSQLSGNTVRFAGLVTVVGVLCFVLFTGTVIITSLNNGLSTLGERMGADIMLVPLGEEVNTEGILIKGEPGYFYFDPELVDDFYAADIEGIDKIERQFFLQSAKQGCCDMSVQFIGINEDDDFTVMPWIRESMNRDGDYLSDLGIVVGSDIDVPEDHQLKFYGHHYNVTGQLEETGTGLDYTVFTNMDTIVDLKQGAIEQGFSFLNEVDPKTNISSILIKVKDGYTIDEVVHNIRASVDGFQIIEAKNITGSVEGSIKGFVILLYILLVAIIILSYIILAITFKLSVYEKASQYALMRGVGASKKQIIRLILNEAAVISGIGTVCGIAFAAIVLFPFKTAISGAVSMPFLFPNALQTVVILAGVAILGISSGPLSAIISAGKISKAPIYQSQRSL